MPQDDVSTDVLVLQTVKHGDLEIDLCVDIQSCADAIDAGAPEVSAHPFVLVRETK